jgi:hypothetical protein
MFFCSYRIVGIARVHENHAVPSAGSSMMFHQPGEPVVISRLSRARIVDSPNVPSATVAASNAQLGIVA